MKRLSVIVAILFITVFSSAQEQKFADIGDFKLESGEVLRDCRIGYRTFGNLNDDKSNVILFPTWAGGTSEQLAGGNIGPGKLADTDKYYVIAVDALANGVSSSPSNSALQPRMKFPKITIRDMVNTQHHLLTRVLGITHVKAVMGISMGGMQTFEWIVAYPHFMDNAIPIVGTPRQDTYDMLHWQAQIDAIKSDPAWQNGEYKENPARTANAQFGMLLLTTPENFNKTHTREQLAKELADAKKAPGQDCNNKIRQTEAMMGLDVSKAFGGSMEQAARAVKAKVLVIVATHDHVVTPGPSREFAKLLNAPIIELTGDCGHQAPGCEEEKVKRSIDELLDQVPPQSDCMLERMKSGQLVTLQGKVEYGPHDMLLSIPNCFSVVLEYAGYPRTQSSDKELMNDRQLADFRKYTEATYKGSGKQICQGCRKYEVEATLSGRIDVATMPPGAVRDALGFARDSRGKILGKVGWGHPLPTYKYRLVIHSVSNVVAHKLPDPAR